MKRRLIRVLRWFGFWPLLMLMGCTGIVVGVDYGPSSAAVQRLGAKLVRVEFEIGSSCSSMEASLAAYQSKGAQPLLLAGFSSYIPTTAQAQSVSQWGACFGPGTTWAASHGGDSLAVHTIEFGNETSYSYQYPGCVGTGSCYSQRAQAYAARFMVARQALRKDVRLLAQADHGGNGTNVWVHGLRLGGLTSAAVGGWTVHPYGPSPTGKIASLISQATAEGFSATIPVDVTEYGITSQECGGSAVNLTDNYGWPTNLSYAQAATDLHLALGSIRSYLGSRLDDIMIYGAKDGLPVCQSNNRESYFGALRSDLLDKGQYSTEVRYQLGR